MEQYLNNDLQNNARTYYRNICLKVARFLSYLGKSLEPYSTQNKLLSFLTTPTSTCDKTVILHLPNDIKQVCTVFKFAVTTNNKHRDEDGDVATNNELYVAYVGPYQKELKNIQVLVNLKIELHYVDPLKEYLVVVLNKENGEILEIFTDKGEDDRNIEPTFEDVMVSWMAVMIWCGQIVVRSLLTYRKPINRYRLSHKIYKLIKQR
nr:7450_t:CDS:2 [Entrophospora candida]